MKKKTEAKTDVQHQEEFEIGKLIAAIFFAAVGKNPVA
jgi:hypothetical protein